MTNTDLRLSTSSLAEDEQRLIHRVYATALDNSLWPEMVVAIVDHVNRLEAIPEDERDYDGITSINAHFDRAYAISDRMVTLQEAAALQENVLKALACDVTLFDKAGLAFFSTTVGISAPAGFIDTATRLALAGPEMAAHVKSCQTEGVMQIWAEDGAHGKVHVLLPKEDVLRLGFPSQAETVLLSCNFNTPAAIEQFAGQYGLTPAQRRFLDAFVLTSDVRQAAQDAGVAYESGRTYLKAIYAKSGTTSQISLLQKVLTNPATLLAKAAAGDPSVLPVRRLLKLPQDKRLEYFSIGPEDGYPVFFFDALAGNSIDSVGHPDRYRKVLNDLGMRLITPCRPGGFRSSYRPLQSVQDYATDVTALCDALGYRKISLLSYSYGSNAALGVAHALPDLVERVTMSSVSYMTYSRENWRDMDMFFQVTNVIGRRWPALLNRLIPFLARSVIQNVHPFAERMLARATCDHERAILGDHRIRARTSEMVAERTAEGMDGVIEEYRVNAQAYDFDVRSITQPMILLHGDCDMNNPLEGAKLLADHAPNATLHILRDMGHHHLFVEWDWIFRAAIGLPFDIPEALRRSHDGVAGPERKKNRP